MNQTKPKETKRRKLYLSDAVQNDVIRRRVIKGQGLREIARETGLARNTVTRILDRNEVVERQQRARSVLLNAAEKMSNRYVRIALKGPFTVAAPVIGRTLEGLHVLVPKTQQELKIQVDDPLMGKAPDELLFYAMTGSWPSEEEREYYRRHGSWEGMEK